MQKSLEPVDHCGCGDTGYLTALTIPVDLAQGVGSIHSVPVYKCQSPACREYVYPAAVTRRLEEIAEEMEQSQVLEASFFWVQASEYTPSLDPLQSNDQLETILQAFTLSFSGQEYEDAEVVDVIPSQSVFLRSKLEFTEYYLLRFDPETNPKDIFFSFGKFYYDHHSFTLQEFSKWENEGGYIKELAILKMSEVREVLNEEFGDLL